MWRRRRRAAAAAAPGPVLWYPGIALRISTRDGEIVLATSDHLYYSARYSGAPECDPGCLPECDRHGWLNLVAGVQTDFAQPPPAGEFSAVPLKIEIKAVRLGGRRLELAEAAAAAEAPADA